MLFLLSAFGKFPPKDATEDTRVLSWDKWLHTYGRHANALGSSRLGKSLDLRKATYLENVKKIQQHNSANKTWDMAVNQFADLTGEEWRKLQGLDHMRERMARFSKQLQKTQKGWIPTAANPLNAASKDWRAEGAVTDVKNQAQCGSCWAFSTTGALEGAWYIKGNRCDGKICSLSEQQLVDCDTNDGGCQGGSMDMGFEFVNSHGITSEENYKYVGRKETCDHDKEADMVIPRLDVSHVDVQRMSMNGLVNGLNLGPVSVAVEADQNAWQFYHSGVMSDSSCGTQLDHGVLAVGYGTDGGQDYYIVKNSWGNSWGEQGFIRLWRNGDGAGICGVQSAPVYPVIGDKPAPTPGPPGPTPPGPTPGPGAAGHYEDPGTSGCKDASDYNIQRLDNYVARMCLPECAGYTCQGVPAPAGYHMKSSCVVLNENNYKFYCAIPCEYDFDCLSGQSCINDSEDGNRLCMFTS